MIGEFKRMISNSKNIVFFGGAGTSTESGIPDFRSERGLYSNEFKGIEPEEILSARFMYENPKLFFKFIKDKIYKPDAKPNIGHKALFQLEEIGKLKSIITQNIDNLHQAAGSKNVIELHGSMFNNYCVGCNKKYSINEVINTKADVPKCKICNGMIRPDVVLYGERLNEKIIKSAIQAIENADMLIVCGTSLIVYPACGLINYYRGNKLVLINPTTTPKDNMADLHIKKKFSEVMSLI